MYLVSCRKGFESDQLLGSENQYRNYTNPADHSVFQAMTKTQILEKATNQHVAILVHGFNNEIPDVMRGYWRVVTQMKDTGVTGTEGYGLVLGFTWPGFSTKAGYFTAAINAKKAAVFLAELVNDVRAVAHTVDVQTHSLGARVALQALKNPKKTFIDNLLLSAPAVDNHLLEPDESFHSSLSSCNRCLVYHSKDDKVLKVAFLVGDVSDGIHKALGLKGPRNKTLTLKSSNLYVVDCAARVHDHSGYKDAKQYFEHWKQVLGGGPLSRYDELS
jgi:esterase/lipase superfamily enzyme